MDVRHATNPDEVKLYDTEELRGRYLVTDMFAPGELRMTYSLQDRVILGGAVPTDKPLTFDPDDALRTEYFCARREVALLNIGGGKAKVTVDGKEFEAGTNDLVYVGKGSKDVAVTSVDPKQPARLFVASTTAHAEYPSALVRQSDVEGNHMGQQSDCNVRDIYRYLDGSGVMTAQMMLGVTHLAEGSVWNTMPCHTHVRRTEAYFYFNLDDPACVFHFMGEPDETRSIVVRNEQAVISPPWSIHCGAGTKNYSFVWVMAGENYQYSDMDHVTMDGLR